VDTWKGDTHASFTTRDIADLVRETAMGARDIPFLNGFCYMIRREVIDRIGIFDERTSPITAKGTITRSGHGRPDTGSPSRLMLMARSAEGLGGRRGVADAAPVSRRRRGRKEVVGAYYNAYRSVHDFMTK
jgi:hypothetical protein